MEISLDKTIRAMAIALDLAEISSVYDIDVVEKVSNVNYSEHKFLHHSKRAAYIALEIAKKLNFEDECLKELYIATLLHDIGASNSIIKSHYSNSFIEEHCRVGASITSLFPVFSNISDVILYHHENYDGSGPLKIHGKDIPIKSQLIRIADLIEISYSEKYPSYKQKNRIIDWVKSNEGIIFSNKLVQAFLEVAKLDIFWFNLEAISSMDFILDSISPKLDIYLDLNQFENIAYIFSKIIDSKSKFTAKHSIGISELAYRVSLHLGYDKEKSLKMKIAGLLHDIGKLAIPTSILDKEGSLTHEEFAIIKSHVYYTKILLDKIEDISDISEWASNHHEKLNGNGYPRSLTGEQLSEESRIICVCDIYQALTEDRPYRKGLSTDKAFSILDGMVTDNFICPLAVQYLKDTLQSYS